MDCTGQQDTAEKIADWHVYHCLPADGHYTDREILVTGGLPSPSELLRRARLRYFAPLIKPDHSDAWTLLALDTDWRSLLEEDLIWMWEQLHHASELKDPRQHYLQWLLLIQASPRYWKKLISRACEHSVLQRKKRQQVRDLHRQALSILRHLLPEEVMTAMPSATTDDVFGCMLCGWRCRSRAGEDAHMFKKHQHISQLRTLSDHPTCPS